MQTHLYDGERSLPASIFHERIARELEHLRSSLALEDIPGAVAFMGLGYAVEALATVPWINNALRKNTWGQNLRLEQERIGWDIAWPTLKEAVAVTRSQ